MTFSESYLFVLVISCLLSIPLGIAIRTLLNSKQRVILPILRLSIATSVNQPLTGQSIAIDQSFVATRSSSVNSAHPLKQGGSHGDRRSVDGKKLGEY
jgi:hypothetical protein